MRHWTSYLGTDDDDINDGRDDSDDNDIYDDRDNGSADFLRYDDDDDDDNNDGGDDNCDDTYIYLYSYLEAKTEKKLFVMKLCL